LPELWGPRKSKAENLGGNYDKEGAVGVKKRILRGQPFF